MMRLMLTFTDNRFSLLHALVFFRVYAVCFHSHMGSLRCYKGNNDDNDCDDDENRGDGGGGALVSAIEQSNGIGIGVGCFW